MLKNLPVAHQQWERTDWRGAPFVSGNPVNRTVVGTRDNRNDRMLTRDLPHNVLISVNINSDC